MGVKTLRVVVALTPTLALQKFLMSEIERWGKVIRDEQHPPGLAKV